MQAFDKLNHLLGVPSIKRKLKAIRLDTLLNNEMDEKDELKYRKLILNEPRRSFLKTLLPAGGPLRSFLKDVNVAVTM
jgi:hypothetical protein